MARIVLLGLSITSSWGNGHATTFRALVKALARRGHEVSFLERDVPWYAENRDQPRSRYCRVRLYRSLEDLNRRFGKLVADADAVIVGSYVPDGKEVGDWVLRHARGVTAFYDIDTPVTLRALEKRDCAYVDRDLLRRYALYLSFTGGPTLQKLEDMGSPRAAAFYCSVDPELHAPVKAQTQWQLGYLGTYSPDRQPSLERMLFDVARCRSQERFIVAGALYPQDTVWPPNVEHAVHLPPDEHPRFYCRQRFTVNVTRADMRQLGYSPSVRLFEAAACGVPIISDPWPGLETILVPGREILVAETTKDVLRHIESTSETERRRIAVAARKRVLQMHSCDHRAAELELLITEVRGAKRRRSIARAAYVQAPSSA